MRSPPQMPSAYRVRIVLGVLPRRIRVWAADSDGAPDTASSACHCQWQRSVRSYQSPLAPKLVSPIRPQEEFPHEVPGPPPRPGPGRGINLPVDPGPGRHGHGDSDPARPGATRSPTEISPPPPEARDSGWNHIYIMSREGYAGKFPHVPAYT